MTEPTKFESYIDTGIEWLGAIPSSWNTILLSQAVYQVKNKNSELQEKNLLSLSYGKIKRKPIDTNGGLLPESFDGYNIIETNDIVLRLTDLQNDHRSLRVGISPERGIITSAYITLRPRKQSGAKYLYYLLHTFDIRKGFYGMGSGVRQGLNYDEVKRLKLPLPTEPEQKAISDYLDSELSRVDVIISESKASIEEYKMWKTSIIYEAVTHGLDPNVETKDSGIEWIGNIPSTWKIVRGKNILVLLDRPVKSTDEVITCFRDGEVTLRKNRREDGFTISLQEAGYQGIEPGDLVVHGMDGFAGAIGVSDSRGKATPVLNVMDSSQNKRFLMYYLRAAAYKDVFMSLSTGIRVRSCDLRWNKIAIFPFIIPPIEKQNEIVNYIDSILPTITAMVEEKEKLISDLESYKKSLIFEVVTGKRRVC